MQIVYKVGAKKIISPFTTIYPAPAHCLARLGGFKPTVEFVTRVNTANVGNVRIENSLCTLRKFHAKTLGYAVNGLKRQHPLAVILHKIDIFAKNILSKNLLFECLSWHQKACCKLLCSMKILAFWRFCHNKTVTEIGMKRAVNHCGNVKSNAPAVRGIVNANIRTSPPSFDILGYISALSLKVSGNEFNSKPLANVVNWRHNINVWR